MDQPLNNNQPPQSLPTGDKRHQQHAQHQVRQQPGRPQHLLLQILNRLEQEDQQPLGAQALN